MQDPFPSLERVDMFIIDQQIAMLEAATQGAYEVPNEYKIFSGDGSYILHAVEESGCCCRLCLHPNHTLTLHVKSSNHLNGPDVFSIHKPFRCCCCAIGPWCQKEITVKKGVTDEVNLT